MSINRIILERDNQGCWAALIQDPDPFGGNALEVPLSDINVLGVTQEIQYALADQDATMVDPPRAEDPRFARLAMDLLFYRDRETPGQLETAARRSRDTAGVASPEGLGGVA